MAAAFPNFEARKAHCLAELKRGADKSPKGFLDAPIAELVTAFNHCAGLVTTSSCSGRITVFAHSTTATKGGKWLLIEHGTVTIPQVMTTIEQYLKTPPTAAAAAAAGADTVSHARDDNESDDLTPDSAAASPVVPDSKSAPSAPRAAVAVVPTASTVNGGSAKPIAGSVAGASASGADRTTGGGGEEMVVFRFEPFILAAECESLELATQLTQLALSSGFRESGTVCSIDTKRSAGKKRFMVSVRCSLRLEVPICCGRRLLVDPTYISFLVETANTKYRENERRIGVFEQNFRKAFASSIAAAPTAIGDTKSIDSIVHATMALSSQLQQTATAAAAAVSASAQPIAATAAAAAPAAPAAAPLGIVCSRDDTKRVKDALKERKWLDKESPIHKFDVAGKPMMCVPLTGKAGIAQCTAASANGTLAALLGLTPLTLSLGRAPDSVATAAAKKTAPAATTASGGGGVVSVGSDPISQFKLRLDAILRQHNLPLSLADDIPKRWEMYGDLVLLPAAAFGSDAWKRVAAAAANGDTKADSKAADSSPAARVMPAVYGALAAALKAKRIARQNEIRSGLKRESAVELLHSLSDAATHSAVEAGRDMGSGWVLHRENGIIYGFDVCQVMFASGNGTEKQRIARLCKSTDVVVDCYAGIGYFTLPYLVHGRVAYLHACELNPNSVRALTHNLHANGVDPSRYTIYPGDNRRPELSRTLRGVADRVNLGLLPSSEDGWPLAINALKSTGGWLHVHANAPAGGESAAAQLVCSRLQLLASKSDDAAKHAWDCRVTHIERVKDYAPRVLHIVIDVFCGPKLSAATATATAIDSKTDEKQRPTSVWGGGAIRIVENPSVHTFDTDISAARRPVILRRVPIGSCVDKWKSADYLAARGPTKSIVSVHVSPSPRLDFVNKNFIYKTMPFDEMIHRMQATAAATTTTTATSTATAAGVAAATPIASASGSASGGGTAVAATTAPAATASIAAASSSMSAAAAYRDRYFISPSEVYYMRALGDNARTEPANFEKSYPALAPDLITPPYLPAGGAFSSVFRVSSPGLQLWTHYDITDNLLCHVTGRKRVVLFPPEQATNLYLPLSADSSSSPVLDIDRPDLDRFPLFVAAARSAIECTLEAGDILFIPALWFHNVTAIDWAVSVNIFWRHLTGAHAARQYVSKDLYGNRDLTAGATAIQCAADAHAALSQLTPHYRSFYTVRARANLDAPFDPSASGAGDGGDARADTKQHSKLKSKTASKSKSIHATADTDASDTASSAAPI